MPKQLDEQRTLYRALLSELTSRGIDHSQQDVFLLVAAAYPSVKTAGEMADVWQALISPPELNSKL